jgi:hypothetical protein
MGSNPAEDDGFLTAINIRSTTFFGGAVKLLAPCHEILQNIKKTLLSMKEILCQQNLRPFLAKFLPASQLGVLGGYCQMVLVDE